MFRALLLVYINLHSPTIDKHAMYTVHKYKTNYIHIVFLPDRYHSDQVLVRRVKMTLGKSKQTLRNNVE